MKRQTILALCALAVLVAVIFLPSAPYSQAQLDPTAARMTINAIINPRLTMTARGIAARTSTRLSELAQTQAVFSTATILALTNTLTPSVTPTYTPSPTPTTTSTPTSTLNPTNEFETLVFSVGQSLTRTVEAGIEASATAAFQQTFDAILWATLGITPTPSPMASSTPTLTPIVSATPPDATDQYKTLIADIDRRLTGTVAVQQTISAQRTIDAIIAGTLSFTSTPTATFTPSVTPTLGAAEIQATLEAQINRNLTETPRAAMAQSATAAFQGTLNAIIGQNQTATATAIRATLVTGLEPLNATSVPQIAGLITITAHSRPVRGVAFTGIGEAFASAGLDNAVRYWSATTGDLLYVWDGLTDRLHVAVSSNGTRLAASSSDATIRLWDLPTRADVAVLSRHTGIVADVAFSSDGRFLASSGADRTVNLWDARTGAFIRAVGSTRTFLGPVNGVTFSPDNLLLATGGDDAQVYLWEVSSGVQIVRLRDIHRVNSVDFSPDGKTLATTGNSNALVLWNWSAQPATNVQLRAPFGRLASVTFSPDGTLVAAGNSNGTFSIWSTAGGPPLITIEAAHPGGVTALAFSPDGTRLVSAGEDGLVRIWGVRAPEGITP